MTTTPPLPREWVRDLAIFMVLGLFTFAILLKLGLAYQSKDAASLESVISLLVGFVTAIFLYLGIKIGKS